MNDAFDIWMGGEDAVEGFFIGGVDVVEYWSFVAYQFDPIQDLLGGIEEIIHDDYFVAGLEECKGREAADVSCPSAPDQ